MTDIERRGAAAEPDAWKCEKCGAVTRSLKKRGEGYRQTNNKTCGVGVYSGTQCPGTLTPLYREKS